MSEIRVTAAREEIRANAAAMGVDEAYISTLVDTFYARVREDATLGPVFDGAIQENWAPHLAQMKLFWSSVALNSGQYSGKPVPAHRKHAETIQASHFDLWLTLFRQTLEDTASTPEAVEYFMIRAERIAKSLKLALFGMPGLGAPRYG